MRRTFKPFKFSFKSNKSIILVDSEKISVDSSEVFDVILSPKYYWAKKENLPVKYTYQAKSYAPSSFDGIVPEGEYKYLVKKADEGYWIYAYDEHYILSEIEKLGLKSSQIRKVYFSQVEFETITKPIAINKNEVLTKHNENIIKVPMQMVQESRSFESFMQNHQLSNFSISLHQFGHLIDFKKMMLVAVALLALIILYGVHYYWLGSELETLQAQQTMIQKKYKMPTTKLQTDALMRTLDKKATTQMDLREKFYKITKTPLIQKEYFSNISYEGKKFTMSLVLSDPKRVGAVESYLKKYFVIDSVQPAGNSVTFGVHYD